MLASNVTPVAPPVTPPVTPTVPTVPTAVTPTASGKPPVWVFAIAGVCAVLGVLVVVGYVLAGPYLFSSGFKAAAYFPRDTWMFADMTVRPGLAQLLSSRNLVEAFTSQPGYDKAIRALETTSSGSSVDYEREVLPLIDGEIALGVMGPTTTPEWLAMVHSNDPDKLLRVLAASEKAPEPRDRYKDALYFERGQVMTASSQSKGWVVSGLSRSLVEQTLDRLSSGSSSDNLGVTDRYQSVVNRLPGERVGFMYFDSRPVMTSPDVKKSLSQVGPAFQDYFSPLTARLAMSLAASNDGVDLRWESIPDQPLHTNRDLARGDALQAFAAMPSDTLFALGGDSLPSLLAGVDEAASTLLRSSLGPSAPQFQFNRWLGGEFAAGIGKGNMRLDARGVTQGTPDVFFVARVKDRTAADADLVGVDKLAGAKSVMVQGVPLRQVGATPESSFYYGVGGDWLYLLYGQPEKVLAQRDARGTGLTNNARFSLVNRAITSKGVGLFANLEDGRRAIEDMFTLQQRETYDKSRVLLLPIRALGGSATTDPTGEAHGELFLAITK
jgi:hypothetical protein